MRRKMSLIRQILEWVLLNDQPWADQRKMLNDLVGEDDKRRTEVDYHVDLCIQAGFVLRRSDPELPPAAKVQLTWQGHEFLASGKGRQQNGDD